MICNDQLKCLIVYISHVVISFFVHLDAAPVRRSRKRKSVVALGTKDGEGSSNVVQTVSREIGN